MNHKECVRDSEPLKLVRHVGFGHKPIYNDTPASNELLLPPKVVKTAQKSNLIERVIIFGRHCTWSYQKYLLCCRSVVGGCSCSSGPGVARPSGSEHRPWGRIEHDRRGPSFFKEESEKD